MFHSLPILMKFKTFLAHVKYWQLRCRYCWKMMRIRSIDSTLLFQSYISRKTSIVTSISWYFHLYLMSFLDNNLLWRSRKFLIYGIIFYLKQRSVYKLMDKQTVLLTQIWLNNSVFFPSCRSLFMYSWLLCTLLHPVWDVHWYAHCSDYASKVLLEKHVHTQ